HRGQFVDNGSSVVLGREYNLAIPGTTTEEWEQIVTAGIFNNQEWLPLRLRSDLYVNDVADRVVIFLGGNDLKNNYSPYYDGADPERFIAQLVSNVRAIVDYVRDLRRTVPIVLANMPDVGITPTIQASKPDPDKRQRNTDLTNEVNRRLRALADEKGIGFADIGRLTDQLTGPERFVIAGVPYIKGVDPDDLSNDPEYLFSPDGFHPNTAAHLLFANAIAGGFNERYPELTPVPLFSTEEMLNILGLEPDMSFNDWATAYGVSSADANNDSDGDGLTLFAEFAIGADPRVPDAEFSPLGLWTGERLEMRYPLRLSEPSQFTQTPEFGTDLRSWTPVPMTQRAITENDEHQAWVTPHVSPCFLRLTFRSP
ncbi:MAG: SGNH/GDSL hydrolase family protein, partial [Verrucomicrobiales bacterium]